MLSRQIRALEHELKVQLFERDNRIPPLRTVEEKLEHVAAGNGIVVLPLSTATFYTRPDIRHVPVCDIAPNQVCLAWDSSRRSALIREYVAIALTGP